MGVEEERRWKEGKEKEDRKKKSYIGRPVLD